MMQSMFANISLLGYYSLKTLNKTRTVQLGIGTTTFLMTLDEEKYKYYLLSRILI